VEGLMKPEDVLVGISTSGNSENVYQAVLKAKEVGGCTIALLGKNGGKIRNAADISIVVPDDCTARIQETHIMIGHILCELAES
ncbi:MAG TPA: phosphoheptose isomerase, partial [Lachnospiraceae bacterium]|nr:phosphoheptose isomerase [Lachnospiraceae bacterium]